MSGSPHSESSAENRPPRARYRFRDYPVGPDRRPAAEAHTFTMRCAMCEVCGPKSESGPAKMGRATRRLKANSDRLAYREIVTRPYLFEPGAWR